MNLVHCLSCKYTHVARRVNILTLFARAPHSSAARLIHQMPWAILPNYGVAKLNISLEYCKTICTFC